LISRTLRRWRNSMSMSLQRCAQVHTCFMYQPGKRNSS
jgi:hypothetical protein